MRAHDNTEAAWQVWQARIASMTREEADFVRDLRNTKGATWRAVASTCAQEWAIDWGGSQLIGMDICERAAEIFGEDYRQPPWN